MKKIILLIVIAAIGWKLYARPHAPAPLATPVADVSSAPPTVQQLLATTGPQFTCDGRVHCAQMTSCEEATWFLQNCPGTKMDGNHDGIPCERQHCR